MAANINWCRLYISLEASVQGSRTLERCAGLEHLQPFQSSRELCRPQALLWRLGYCQPLSASASSQNVCCCRAPECLAHEAQVPIHDLQSVYFEKYDQEHGLPRYRCTAAYAPR